MSLQHSNQASHPFTFLPKRKLAATTGPQSSKAHILLIEEPESLDLAIPPAPPRIATTDTTPLRPHFKLHDKASALRIDLPPAPAIIPPPRPASTQPLIRKKSGDIVKPSLKSTCSSSVLTPNPNLSARSRTKSAPATPSAEPRPLPPTPKSVHFDTQLEYVKFFLAEQKPKAVSRAGEGHSPMGETSEGDTTDTNAGYPFPTMGGGGGTGAGVLKLKTVLGPDMLAFGYPWSFDVRLESISLDTTPSSTPSSTPSIALTGTILVRNVAFAKSVFVRFTLDNWNTTSEVSAKHIATIREGVFDRFEFRVGLGDYMFAARGGLESRRMVFCVRYAVGGGEFWDSNGGKNYEVGFERVRGGAVNGVAKSGNGRRNMFRAGSLALGLFDDSDTSPLPTPIPASTSSSSTSSSTPTPPPPSPGPSLSSLSSRYSFNKSLLRPTWRPPSPTPSPSVVGERERERKGIGMGARRMTLPMTAPSPASKTASEFSYVARTRGSPREVGDVEVEHHDGFGKEGTRRRDGSLSPSASFPGRHHRRGYERSLSTGYFDFAPASNANASTSPPNSVAFPSSSPPKPAPLDMSTGRMGMAMGRARMTPPGTPVLSKASSNLPMHAQNDYDNDVSLLSTPSGPPRSPPTTPTDTSRSISPPTLSRTPTPTLSNPNTYPPEVTTPTQGVVTFPFTSITTDDDDENHDNTIGHPARSASDSSISSDTSTMSTTTSTSTSSLFLTPSTRSLFSDTETETEFSPHPNDDPDPDPDPAETETPSLLTSFSSTPSLMSPIGEDGPTPSSFGSMFVDVDDDTTRGMIMKRGGGRARSGGGSGGGTTGNGGVGVNSAGYYSLLDQFCFFTGVNNTYPSMGMGGIEEDRRRNAMEDYLSMALGGVEGV